MDWCETSAEVERARAEIPVIIRGPDGALFGIFTPPAPEAPSAGLCVVMPTAVAAPIATRPQAVRPTRYMSILLVEGERYGHHSPGKV